MNFFTQITMEAAEDPEFLNAMRKARIKGALVGVESVTAEGLKDVYKGFNLYGEALVQRLQQFKAHGIHVLGSFIFGLPSDRAETFNATAALALKADVTFAQFVMLTPFPGTVDFAKWELGESKKKDAEAVDGIPITRHWLIPQARRPKVYTPHPTLVGRRNPRAYAGCVGPVLQPPTRLAPIAGGEVAEKPHRLRAVLEAVPPDVCEHRHRHRQRAPRQVRAHGQASRQAVPQAVHRETDARSPDTGLKGPKSPYQPSRRCSNSPPRSLSLE